MAPKRRRPRRIDERPAAVRAAKDDDDDHVEGNSENHSEDESDGAHGKEKRREHYEYADHKVWCSKWYRKFEKHEDDVEIEQADGKQKTAGGSVAWGYRDQDWIEKGKIKDGGSTVSSYIIASPDQNPSMLGSKISCGDTIELKNGAFIRVDRISIFPGNAEVTLSGNLFERNMRLMGWLPRPENEVFELWTFQPGENIETATAYVVNASVSTVRRIWDLHMLPPRLPLYNFPPAPVLASAPNTDQATSAASATSRGTLVCSWKYIVACHTRNFIHRTHYNQTAHTQGQYDEKCLVPVGPPTETPIKTTKTKARRKTKTKTKKKIEDSLASFKSSSCASRPLPSYTFGDAFAGCGGMSRGATMAGGFKVKWGFDANKGAITAFNMNFPNARALHQWSHEFVALNAGTGTGSDSETESEFHVDVLHVSPPCQYFSLAHTRDGANDEQNVAALFAIPELIRKTTPRVVTVEQVPHIMKGHPAFFSALVRFFTCFGYSIRWKVINCVDFGVAQRFRRRLFMIGSRPGVNLPGFPSPTHVGAPDPQSPHLQRWTSVADAISNIPQDCTENERGPRIVNGGTYNEYLPHNRTVMAGGPNMCLPNGMGPLTLRELACLQSFPFEDRFHGRRDEKRAQIGNAVPPLVGQAILKEVRRSLMETDKAPPPAPKDEDDQS